MKRYWLCKKCRQRWQRTITNCRTPGCEGVKPAAREPKHKVALTIGYEDYVELNGGDFCGVCLRPRKTDRRFDRDHCHRTGRPRGLLCHKCNRALPSWMTPEWCRAAATYLERSTT